MGASVLTYSSVQFSSLLNVNMCGTSVLPLCHTRIIIMAYLVDHAGVHMHVFVYCYSVLLIFVINLLLLEVA